MQVPYWFTPLLIGGAADCCFFDLRRDAVTPDTPEAGLGGVAGTGAMSDTVKTMTEGFFLNILFTSILKQCCLPVDPQLPEVVDEVVDDEEDMFEQR